MGTWNVRTMLKAGKLEEVKEQMKKANLNILGVCETRWAGNGDFTSEEFRIIHSGNETRGRSGVALILKGEWKDSVLNTYHLSDRILMIKLEAIPNNIYIIQVYFPTSSSTEEEIDSIYEQIEDLLQLTDEKSNVFIMGDFNASVGNQTGTNTGKFGLGNRNQRGTRLVEFCEQHDLIVSNTYFEVPNRRRYTWKAPGDRNRFQIDYILTKKKFRKQILSSHAYPGYDVDSDHNLVMARCHFQPKKKFNKPKNKKWSVEKLKDQNVARTFKQELDKLVDQKEDWDSLKDHISKTADKVLGKNKLEPRKPWMTREILDLITQRNKWRKKDQVRYKQLKNQIEMKCQERKEKWLEENSKEIEMDIRTNQMDKAYTKIKKLQLKPKTKSNIVKDNNGKILFDNEMVADRWKEYIEDLYDGDNIISEQDYIENEDGIPPESLGAEITKDEFFNAMIDLKEKKATSNDSIPAEIIKNLGNKTDDILFNIIKECYKSGKIPEDFIKSKTITIPKKGNATECSNYRTIAILSHASKILLNIVKNRLKSKVDQHLSDDQFGFRTGKGTREAILALRQILERRIAVNKPTYATFIDLEKAFDKINWKLLFQILKDKGINWRDRRVIFNLYKTQTTQIDINGSVREARIKQGVRQGCPLSPYLFNLFIELAIDAMKSQSNGVTINEGQVHCIRFADDIVTLAESERDMNTMLNVLDAALTHYKLKINSKKTKTMLIKKDPIHQNIFIKLGNTLLQQVQEFNYLGSVINTNNKSTIDINRRVILAKQAFLNKNKLLTNEHINIEIRKNFIKTFVWSVLTYGSETWTIDKRDRMRLEATEMWMWRRMTKTSWIEKKSNERLLREIRESRQLMNTIESRRIKLIGHIIRHNSFINNIFEREVGRRPRGRPRKEYFQDIMESMGCRSYGELKNVAMDREEWLHRQGPAFRQ
ncbi:hypothetical protein M8J77_003669 [Diaphorina citri]|nr:hypothetical protein M8J77_003669 [Diaphorina citri]